MQRKTQMKAFCLEKTIIVFAWSYFKGLGSALDVGVREDSQASSLPSEVGDGALDRESGMGGGPGVWGHAFPNQIAFLIISLISALSNRVTSSKTLVPSPYLQCLAQQFPLL